MNSLRIIIKIYHKKMKINYLKLVKVKNIMKINK